MIDLFSKESINYSIIIFVMIIIVLLMCFSFYYILPNNYFLYDNKYKLYTVTGINIIDTYIYVSTLLNVIRINLSDNYNIEICIEDNKLCLFYDNISLNKKL